MAQDVAASDLSVEPTPTGQPAGRARSAARWACLLVAVLLGASVAWVVPRAVASRVLGRELAAKRSEGALLDQAISSQRARVQALRSEIQHQLALQAASARRSSTLRAKIRGVHGDIGDLRDRIAAAQAAAAATPSTPPIHVSPLHCHTVFEDTNGDGIVDRVHTVCT